MSIVLFMMLRDVECKPDGPPQDACHSMRPGTEQGVFGHIGHVRSPQNVQYNGMKSPYYIQLYNSEKYWDPGQQITCKYMDSTHEYVIK